MHKTLIVIKRDSPHDIKMRDLLLFLDGDEVANIPYGHTYETDVAPGEHTVMVSNRLYSETMTVTLEEGQEAHFGASNDMSGVGLIMLEIFGVGPYRAHLERVD